MDIFTTDNVVAYLAIGLAVTIFKVVFNFATGRWGYASPPTHVPYHVRAKWEKKHKYETARRAGIGCSVILTPFVWPLTALYFLSILIGWLVTR